MYFRIRKCFNCGRYMLKEVCLVCGSEIKVVYFLCFLLEDLYGEYRWRFKCEFFGIGRRF